MKSFSLAFRSACCVTVALLTCGAASAQTVDLATKLTPNGPLVVEVNAIGLTGSISNLKIKPSANGSTLKVKATVSVANNNLSAVKHVGATVYLSADGTLSDDDMKLITLDLADFVVKGKIGKGKTVSFPISKKVPSVLAAYLEGKYIIVVPSVDGQTAGDPIVVGPIKVP